MAGLRESMVGRAVLVAAALALAWAAWNLTLRPYPSDYCDGPVSVLTRSPEPVEDRPVVRSDPPPLDVNGDGKVTNAERRFHDASRDAPRASGQLSSFDYGELRNDRCRDALAEAGFWIRGLWPLLLIVGGAVIFRYVRTGRVWWDSTHDSEKRSVVK